MGTTKNFAEFLRKKLEADPALASQVNQESLHADLEQEYVDSLQAEIDRLRAMGLALLEEWNALATKVAAGRFKEKGQCEYNRRKAEWEK